MHEILKKKKGVGVGAEGITSFYAVLRLACGNLKLAGPTSWKTPRNSCKERSFRHSLPETEENSCFDSSFSSCWGRKVPLAALFYNTCPNLLPHFQGERNFVYHPFTRDLTGNFLPFEHQKVPQPLVLLLSGHPVGHGLSSSFQMTSTSSGGYLTKFCTLLSACSVNSCLLSWVLTLHNLEHVFCICEFSVR